MRESLLGPCSLLMVALDASKNIRTSLPPLHPPSLSISLSLSLVLPLCLWGIAHSSLQKRHQVRSRYTHHAQISQLHAQVPQVFLQTLFFVLEHPFLRPPVVCTWGSIPPASKRHCNANKLALGSGNVSPVPGSKTPFATRMQLLGSLNSYRITHSRTHTSDV